MIKKIRLRKRIKFEGKMCKRKSNFAKVKKKKNTREERNGEKMKTKTNEDDIWKRRKSKEVKEEV